MAEDTLIQQGYFTSDGTDKIISLRSDVDWVEVTNLTNIAGATQWKGVRWFWQRGMSDNDAVVEYHAAASQAISMSTAAVGYNGTVMRGISLIDTSNLYTVVEDVTAGTNATQPVYSTAATYRLAEGAIVRIYGTDHTNINGLDFTVDTVVADTSFRLANTLEQAPGVVAGANGAWKYIAPNVTVYNTFNPRQRVIANITQASPAVVTTLVDHGFSTGQKVRMVVPSNGSMTELNDVIVTVTVIDAATFSIGIDTTGYGAFNYPLPGEMPETFSQVVPVGGTDGEQVDQGFLGMILGTSATAGIASGSPGGTTGDVIKWRAGKSFRYDIG